MIKKTAMELFCEKYKEKMAGETAVCRHPGEYCKFRSGCIIHFLGKENASNGQSSSDESEKAEKEKE